MIPPLNASICQVFVHISGAPDLEKDMEWSRYDVMKGEGVREVCGVRAFHAQDVEIVYASKQERKKQLRSNSQLDSTYQPLINTHYISLLITITPGKKIQ